MANFTVAPGVEINETDREYIQVIADRFDEYRLFDSGPHVQAMFHKHISVILDINERDAEVFTLI